MKKTILAILTIGFLFSVSPILKPMGAVADDSVYLPKTEDRGKHDGFAPLKLENLIQDYLEGRGNPELLRTSFRALKLSGSGLLQKVKQFINEKYYQSSPERSLELLSLISEVESEN
ncbi:MAG: hypothetical protein PHW04_17835 [Candidatus Wallbacteria bacterium]|nr:hypothetical protein [Candidatus Wallbacteria bacterium]